jgi:acid phosphatase (class A)
MPNATPQQLTCLLSAATATEGTPDVILLVLATIGLAVAAEATYVSQDRFDFTKLLAPAPAARLRATEARPRAVLAVQKPRRRRNRSARSMMPPSALPTCSARTSTRNACPRWRCCSPRSAAMPRSRSRPARMPGTGRAPSRSAPTSIRSATGRAAYPSGNSTNGYLTGIVLAMPEKATALFARRREFGDDRVILGVHFPSDVEAGRLAATALAAALMQDPAFMKDFAEAKSQLRRARGLWRVRLAAEDIRSRRLVWRSRRPRSG